MGREKAQVFPDPVWARPMMSRPWRASGMASCWIWVGLVNFMVSQASHKGAITPSEANVGAGPSLATEAATADEVEDEAEASEGAGEGEREVDAS